MTKMRNSESHSDVEGSRSCFSPKDSLRKNASFQCINLERCNHRKSTSCLGSSNDGERIFLPTLHGSLITQLGTGPLSRRVFVLRSPTRLSENIVTSHFAQSKYTDLLKLLEKLNICVQGTNGLFLKKNMSTSVDQDLLKSFWPRVLIWDLPISRPGLAYEFPKLKKLVLTFRLLDVGCPTVKFVMSLCNSLLFWLCLTNHSRNEETYAIISYYEANPVFLALLGCILLAIDSYGSYPMDLHHVSNVLSAASAFTKDSVMNTERRKKGSRIIQPSVYAAGVLSWVSMDRWNPSSFRLLERFHQLAANENQPLIPVSYKLKSIFINNFIGPLSKLVIEIYKVHDVNIVDGQVQKDRITHEVLLYRNSFDEHMDYVSSDTSSPHASSSGGTTEFFDTVNGPEINLLSPWEYWKHQQAECCLNSSCKHFKMSKKSKKKSFTQRTFTATKRFFKSIKSSVEMKGNHIFGVSGCAMKNTMQDDLSMQLQLLSDQNCYSVVVEEVKQDGTINVVVDFLNINEDQQDKPPNKRFPIVLCGDILIVIRQESPDFVVRDNHAIHTATEMSKFPSCNKTIGLGFSLRKSDTLSGSITPLSSSRLFSAYDHSKSIFAIYSFHTGFALPSAESPAPELFNVVYQDFDILDSQRDFIPNNFEMSLVCEYLQPSVLNSVKNASTDTSMGKKKKSKGTFSKSASRLSLQSWDNGSDCPVRHKCLNVPQERGVDITPRNYKYDMHNLRHFPEDSQNYANSSFCKIERDIESFLRYHPVKPHEGYLVSFLKEGYSLFTSVLALKVTNNDAWNALQFFLRLPQLDSRNPYCITDARGVFQDNIPRSLFDLSNENFDFKKELNIATYTRERFERTISKLPDNFDRKSVKISLKKDVAPHQETCSFPSQESFTGKPTDDVKKQVNYPGSVPDFYFTETPISPSNEVKLASAEPVKSSNISQRFGIQKKVITIKARQLSTQGKKLAVPSSTSELRRRPLPPPPALGLLKQHKPPPLGRKIFWKPLQASNIQGTVFEQLSDKPVEASHVVDVSSIVDSNHLTRLFTKKNYGSSQFVKKSAVPEQQKITLFWSKRAQNLSIILARVTFSIDKVVDALHLLQLNDIPVDEIEKIEPCLLSNDEDNAYSQFLNNGGDVSQLRQIPEQKLFAIRPSVTFRIRESIAILKFVESHETISRSVRESLIVINKAIQEVQNSQKFRQLLSVILRWGNYVNYGISQGDLYIRGFTLGSLLKLTDFKTIIDTKTTALHYLAANLLKGIPAMCMENLHEDMPTVKQASKISSEGLAYSMNSIRQGWNFVQAELKHNMECLRNQESLCIPDTVLAQRIEQLSSLDTQYLQEIQELEEDYLRVKKAAYDTARFFGDDIAHQSEFDQAFPHESFLGTLTNFIDKFKTCCEEVLQQPGKLETLLATRNSNHPSTDLTLPSMKETDRNEIDKAKTHSHNFVSLESLVHPQTSE